MAKSNYSILDKEASVTLNGVVSSLLTIGVSFGVFALGPEEVKEISASSAAIYGGIATVVNGAMSLWTRYKVYSERTVRGD